MTVPRSKLTKRQEISKAVNSMLFHGAVEGASAIVNNYKNKEIDKEELILKVEKDLHESVDLYIETIRKLIL